MEEKVDVPIVSATGLENMNLLSIVVPIYNVENYLAECLDSLIKYAGIESEIILIDDGSTDNSAEICDAYATQDSRVIVVHKKNAGVSSARNCGLEIPKGEYITFVDGDDYINCSFSNVIQRLVSESPQLLISGYSLVDEKSRKIKSTEYIRQSLSVSQVLQNMFDYKNGLSLKPAVWNKIYKRNLIGSLRFDEDLSISEDLKFNIEYLKNIKEADIAESAYYNWRQREDSVTKRGGKIIDIVKTVKTDMYIYDTISVLSSEERNIFLAWMVQDNIGWYRVGKKIARNRSERTTLRKMKITAMSHPFRVLVCPNINWKERIIYIFGKY